MCVSACWLPQGTKWLNNYYSKCNFPLFFISIMLQLLISHNYKNIYCWASFFCQSAIKFRDSMQHIYVCVCARWVLFLMWIADTHPHTISQRMFTVWDVSGFSLLAATITSFTPNCKVKHTFSSFHFNYSLFGHDSTVFCKSICLCIGSGCIEKSLVTNKPNNLSLSS